MGTRHKGIFREKVLILVVVCSCLDIVTIRLVLVIINRRIISYIFSIVNYSVSVSKHSHTITHCQVLEE